MPTVSSCFSADLGFESEDALAEYATMGGYLFGAIVFISDKWVELPKKMRYKIRLRSGKLELKSHKRVKIEWKTNVMFSGQDGPVIGNVKAKGPGSTTVDDTLTSYSSICVNLFMIIINEKQTNLTG